VSRAITVLTGSSFWINYGMVHNVPKTSSSAWRIPMAVQLLPAGLLTIGLPFLRESPLWLLKRGRDEEAYKVLSYIRNLPVDHQYILEDVMFVKGQIAHEQAVTHGDRPTFGAFLRGASREAVMKGMRNRFILVFIMFMWQAWSGAAAINYCEIAILQIRDRQWTDLFVADSPTIFTSIGLTDTTLWTGVYGLIKAGGSIIFFTFFVDTFVGHTSLRIVTIVLTAPARVANGHGSSPRCPAQPASTSLPATSPWPTLPAPRTKPTRHPAL